MLHSGNTHEIFGYVRLLQSSIINFGLTFGRQRLNVSQRRHFYFSEKVLPKSILVDSLLEPHSFSFFALHRVSVLFTFGQSTSGEKLTNEQIFEKESTKRTNERWWKNITRTNTNSSTHTHKHTNTHKHTTRKTKSHSKEQTKTKHLENLCFFSVESCHFWIYSPPHFAVALLDVWLTVASTWHRRKT